MERTSILTGSSTFPLDRDKKDVTHNNPPPSIGTNNPTRFIYIALTDFQVQLLFLRIMSLGALPACANSAGFFSFLFSVFVLGFGPS